MSAHWVIDETQDPVSCRAHMKIAVYEKPPYPERGYDQYHGSGALNAVRKQCTQWNTQRERVRLHDGRSAVVTFEIDTRPTNAQESSLLSTLLNARHPLLPDAGATPPSPQCSRQHAPLCSDERARTKPCIHRNAWPRQSANQLPCHVLRSFDKARPNAPPGTGVCIPHIRSRSRPSTRPR